MNIQLSKILLSISIIILLISCDKQKQFTVNGTVSNADTLMLYLEKRGHSDIAILDSVKLNSSGDFSFKQNALGYTEFYRLKLGNQSINFAIDSTETITINTDKSTFATNYKIEGSVDNSQIKDVALSHAKFVANINEIRSKHANKILTDEELLNEIDTTFSTYRENTKQFITNNFNSTAAYYALFQRIDNYLIFDPANKQDLYLFRAVATVWDNFRPQAPRSAHLKNYTLSAIASAKAEENQVATLEKLIDTRPTENKNFFSISLPDINNKEVSTLSLKGKIVLLDFTAYKAEYSVAHNVMLNKIYEKHRSGIEIYQVSFDTQKHDWQNAATNLPWITVWDNQSLNSPIIGKFNVEVLPTTYILDKEGNIVKKLNLNDNLEKEIAKFL